MAKQNTEQVLSVIQEKFQAGEAFTAKNLKEAYLDNSLNVSYFMKVLVKKGEIVQLQKNVWALPGILKDDATIPTPLYISKTERNILEIISKIDAKSENGTSRFGLDKLKECLSEEESALLTDLIPKLKSVGIMSCIGNGAQGKILEIREDLFLKYITDPEAIKEISLTDLEIDQRIKRYLCEEDRKQKRALEIEEQVETREDELLNCLTQIEVLTKTQDSLEKELKGLRQELKRIEGSTNENERQFVKLLAEMDPDKRRTIFKKFLV